MNCIKHNDVVAVGSCGKCNVGLCTECINDAMRDDDNKPMCQKCTLDVVIDPHIAYLQTALGQIAQKRIVWSVILVIGLALGVLGYFSDSVMYIIIGILVWSCAGFSDRMLARANQSAEDAHYNALARHRMETDGSYLLGSMIGKVIGWLLRGIFFPIVYLIFMLTGVKKLKKELADMQEARDILVSKM